MTHPLLRFLASRRNATPAPPPHPVYTFIHPTKTGGTACEELFKKYYPARITGGEHKNVCTNTNNSIIIVRDIYSRFLSMFNYWKNGAVDSDYKRDAAFKKQNNVTILDFIKLLKANNTRRLNVTFTTDLHFKPVKWWMRNVDYKNVIVIKYESDLNAKIDKLLEELEIPKVHTKLPIFNVSAKRAEDMKVYEDNKAEIDAFIEKYLKEDADLWNLINNHPERFKMVL